MFQIKFENAAVRDQYIKLYQAFNPQGTEEIDQFETATTIADTTDRQSGCFSATDMAAMTEGVYEAEIKWATRSARVAFLTENVNNIVTHTRKLHELQRAELCSK
ncbi:MAG: hypothetical protein R3C68_14725 [Myxococcota bacterium]